MHFIAVKFLMLFRYKRIDSTSKMFYVLAQHWVESVNATMVTDFQRTWGYNDTKTGQITGNYTKMLQKITECV